MLTKNLMMKNMHLAKFNIKPVNSTANLKNGYTSIFLKNIIGKSDKFKQSGQSIESFKVCGPKLQNRVQNIFSSEENLNTAMKYIRQLKEKHRSQVANKRTMGKINSMTNLYSVKTPSMAINKMNPSSSVTRIKPNERYDFDRMSEDNLQNSRKNSNIMMSSNNYRNNPVDGVIRPPNERLNFDIGNSDIKMKNNNNFDNNPSHSHHKKNVSVFINSSNILKKSDSNISVISEKDKETLTNKNTINKDRACSSHRKDNSQYITPKYNEDIIRDDDINRTENCIENKEDNLNNPNENNIEDMNEYENNYDNNNNNQYNNGYIDNNQYNNGYIDNNEVYKEDNNDYYKNEDNDIVNNNLYEDNEEIIQDNRNYRKKNPNKVIINPQETQNIDYEKENKMESIDKNEEREIEKNFSGFILKRYESGEEVNSIIIDENKEEDLDLNQINSLLQLNMYKINSKLLQFIDTQMNKMNQINQEVNKSRNKHNNDNKIQPEYNDNQEIRNNNNYNSFSLTEQCKVESFNFVRKNRKISDQFFDDDYKDNREKEKDEDNNYNKHEEEQDEDEEEKKEVYKKLVKRTVLKFKQIIDDTKEEEEEENFKKEFEICNESKLYYLPEQKLVEELIQYKGNKEEENEKEEEEEKENEKEGERMFDLDNISLCQTESLSLIQKNDKEENPIDNEKKRVFKKVLKIKKDENIKIDQFEVNYIHNNDSPVSSGSKLRAKKNLTIEEEKEPYEFKNLSLCFNEEFEFEECPMPYHFEKLQLCKNDKFNLLLSYKEKIPNKVCKNERFSFKQDPVPNLFKNMKQCSDGSFSFDETKLPYMFKGIEFCTNEDFSFEEKKIQSTFTDRELCTNEDSNLLHQKLKPTSTLNPKPTTPIKKNIKITSTDKFTFIHNEKPYQFRGIEFSTNEQFNVESNEKQKSFKKIKPSPTEKFCYTHEPYQFKNVELCSEEELKLHIPQTTTPNLFKEIILCKDEQIDMLPTNTPTKFKNIEFYSNKDENINIEQTPYKFKNISLCPNEEISLEQIQIIKKEIQIIQPLTENKEIEFNYEGVQKLAKKKVILPRRRFSGVKECQSEKINVVQMDKRRWNSELPFNSKSGYNNCSKIPSTKYLKYKVFVIPKEDDSNPSSDKKPNYEISPQKRFSYSKSEKNISTPGALSNASDLGSVIENLKPQNEENPSGGWFSSTFSKLKNTFGFNNDSQELITLQTAIEKKEENKEKQEKKVEEKQEEKQDNTVENALGADKPANPIENIQNENPLINNNKNGELIQNYCLFANENLENVPETKKNIIIDSIVETPREDIDSSRDIKLDGEEDKKEKKETKEEKKEKMEDPNKLKEMTVDNPEQKELYDIISKKNFGHVKKKKKTFVAFKDENPEEKREAEQEVEKLKNAIKTKMKTKNLLSKLKNKKK